MAITLDNVYFSYNSDHKILDGFSLVLPERGVICLSGPSGCGKTTLLRLLAGLEQPQGGSIEGLDGLHTAVVFQENRLLPWQSVLDNVAVVLHGTDARTRAADWLTRVGLGSELNKRPDELSGGMKRRVALARALAVQADLLILDEPFEGLDNALWVAISREILTAYADKPVVLVTHRTEHAAAMNAPIVYLDGLPLRRVMGS